MKSDIKLVFNACTSLVTLVFLNLCNNRYMYDTD